ncbi:MAG: family 43 glycosylhydrolase [Clostridia bacterium]|nr:family 43 glycosylhydrolase [Clostridia bacterium]
MKIPYISSEWKELLKPHESGNYINDHTIFKAHDGNWHLFGISSFLGGATNERWFAHGVTPSLDTPMREMRREIDRGTLAWAPCVIRTEEDYYYMFYGPSPTSLSVSFDLYEWYNHTITLKNEPLFGAHRDHFVLTLDDGSYLMYVAGTKDKRSCISLFHSQNLIEWEFEGYAMTSGEDAPLNPAWGAMESPYVIQIDGLYYLFVTYTDSAKENYHNTLVFVSSNPHNFGIYNGGNGGAIPITTLHAHAPEIVLDDGQYYITTCGWLDYDTPISGAVAIAKLDFKEQ